MDSYRLYYAPGACSISPHVALREAKLPFELVKVDLRAKTAANGDDWLAMNPKGYVPALRAPNGDVITEGAIMVQYIADHAPTSKLAPPAGTMDRVRLAEALHFIATELHKGSSPLYNPVANEDYKVQLRERLSSRFAVLASMVHGHTWLMGEQFTVADPYAFYVMRAWKKVFHQDLGTWPDLAAYYDRLAARPTIAESLKAEGLEA
jgi:glutathione S-transferase|nr:glutathione transferase GstA [Kofleriaceae bacterium]